MYTLALVSSVAMAEDRRPRIAVGGISHESNSFNPARTTLDEFGRWKDVTAEEFFTAAAGSSSIVGGYVEGARQFGLELLPTVVVSATPKGPVAADAFAALMDEMIRRLKSLPNLDGVLLAQHGAMVVEGFPSGDLEVVRRVRQAVGKSVPIVVTHDFHANIFPEIIEQCDVLLTFKENPHIDTRERGFEAARIMSQIASGKAKPVQAIVKPPMIYNIVYQYTRREPLLPAVEESRRLEQNPRILAASVSGGYQYADVLQMGPSVVVVTDGDKALAEREAKRLADMLWGARDKLVLKLPGAAAAVKLAAESDRFPVALMDMGDNIGGGSAGDSTFLLAELIRQRARGWVVVLADPEAVSIAVKAGIGGQFDSPAGGRKDRFHGDPVRVRGRVRSLHDGRYYEPEVRHGGSHHYQMGLSAVIEVEGSTGDLASYLLLTTERSSPNSIQQLVSCGIDPQRQKIITVKGAIAPRAAYEPVAARIIEVDTPGLTAVNPSRFTYQNVRRPLFGIQAP